MRARLSPSVARTPAARSSVTAASRAPSRGPNRRDAAVPRGPRRSRPRRAQRCRRSADRTATTRAPHPEPAAARCHRQPARSTHNRRERAQASRRPAKTTASARAPAAEAFRGQVARPRSSPRARPQRAHATTRQRRPPRPLTSRRAPPPVRLTLHKPFRATVTPWPPAVNAGSLPVSARQRRAQQTPQARSISRDHHRAMAGRIDERDRPSIRGEARLRRMTT